MNKDEKGLSWYDCSGDMMDVVLSSRVRLARNLANFPFPDCYKNDDSERVQIIILAAFSQLQDADNYHSIESKDLSVTSAGILIERGVLENHQTALVMRNDGYVSTAINCTDHLRISSFRNGLSLRKSFDECIKVDMDLQKNLQFAASYGFGFLTQKIPDCGSGMKLSCRVHLASSVMLGKLNLIIEYCKQTKLKIEPAFPNIGQGSAAGSFFLISSTNAFDGNELDQLANFESCIKYIVETERKISTEYADNKSTLIRNSVIRAYSIAKFSLFISLREALDIISDLKLGLRLGLLKGIDDSALSGLLYKVQKSHLTYLLESGDFDFEQDIKNDQNAKVDRLRALTLQEAFEHISLGNL